MSEDQAEPTIDELAQKCADASLEFQRRSDLLRDAQIAFNNAEYQAQQCSSLLNNAIRLLISSKKQPVSEPAPENRARARCQERGP